jgi:surface protein
MSYVRKRNGVYVNNLAKHNGVEKRLTAKHNGVSPPVFKVDVTTTDVNQTVQLRLDSGGWYNFNVQWDDGGSEEVVTAWNDANASHQYASAGTYTVEVRGIFAGWYVANNAERDYFVDLKQWGCYEPSLLNNLFYGCSNLNVSATDTWDGLETTPESQISFNAAFRSCGELTDLPNCDTWDMTKVNAYQQLGSMFRGCAKFNGSGVASWDVGNITDFSYMFSGNNAFNQDVGDWDTSSATTMTYMFNQCTIFNQDLSDWDVSGVTNMAAMFLDCTAFNNGGQALSTETGGTPTGWNTASLTGSGAVNIIRT